MLVRLRVGDCFEWRTQHLRNGFCIIFAVISSCTFFGNRMPSPTSFWPLGLVRAISVALRDTYFPLTQTSDFRCTESTESIDTALSCAFFSVKNFPAWCSYQFGYIASRVLNVSKFTCVLHTAHNPYLRAHCAGSSKGTCNRTLYAERIEISLRCMGMFSSPEPKRVYRVRHDSSSPAVACIYCLMLLHSTYRSPYK